MTAHDVLPLCACFRSRTMARAITSLYDETLEESGLKTSQFAILATIRAHGAVRMQELASELGLDPSTMTRTLVPMEQAGLVASEAGEDRRVRELALTARGHRKLADASKLWTAAQKRLRDRIGRERFERIVEDMGEVLAALRDQDSPAE